MYDSYIANVSVLTHVKNGCGPRQQQKSYPCTQVSCTCVEVDLLIEWAPMAPPVS